MGNLLTNFVTSKLLCQLSFYPRHLHSSPTRRSSDLAPVRRRPIPPFDNFVAARPDFLKDALGNSLGFDRTDFVLDRKSTRLNSSHMSISYAVFCLKKKKIDRLRFYAFILYSPEKIAI